jgi:hypothetical protein
MKYTTESQRLDGGEGHSMAQTTVNRSFGPSLTVMGPCWPLCWLLWTVVGLRWLAWPSLAPLLAVVDLCWPALVFYGLRWLALACIGLRWLSWACVGLRWLSWVLAVLHWPSLPSSAFVGLRWPSRPDYYLNTYKISLVKTINQKNRTYLGPNDVSRRLGPHHPVVGLPSSWPLLALVGLRWLSWVLAVPR